MILRMLGGTLLLSLAIVMASAGDQVEPRNSTFPGKTPPPELPLFTVERETVALQFVEQNHAELGKLLAGLKELRRAEYEQAIRELFHTRERLLAIRQTDQDLYTLSLEIWQVESQIKILAARHAILAQPDPQIQAELLALLYKQVDLQRHIVEHNRDKLLESLQVMNANIQLLKDKREEFVQRRLHSLTKTPAKAKPKPMP